jgi:hypothetical protein
MPVLRNSRLLFQRDTPSSDVLEAGPFVLRPSDGDNVEDPNQRFFIMVYVEQQGAGSVNIEFLLGFGDGLWAILGQDTLTEDGDYEFVFGDIQDVPPYVKARITPAGPLPEDDPPTFIATGRIASNAPFRVGRANVPTTVERIPTEWVNDNGPDDGGDGGDGGDPGETP